MKKIFAGLAVVIIAAAGLFFLASATGQGMLLFPADYSHNKTYTTLSAIDTALNALNEIRGSAYLGNVTLVSEASAEYRAEDMLSNMYFGHYDLNGYSPSFYYTKLGGNYSMEENIAYEYYSRDLGFNQLMSFVNSSLYTMVYNDSNHGWGHRDSLMDPTNNMVSISFAYDENHAFLVIHMIKEWVTWENPPTFAEGVFSCSGDWSVSGQSIKNVNIEFSDPEQHSGTTYNSNLGLNETGESYSSGDVVAGVAPMPFHFNNVTTIRPLTWDVNTGSPLDSHFDFSFKLKPFKGTGVYTIVVWGTRPALPSHPFDPTRYSDGIPVLEYSVFISNDSGSSSFIVDSYLIEDNAHVTVMLRDNGQTALNISAASVDGAPASINPGSLNPGDSNQFTINGSGTSWADGSTHSIKITASDGTVATVTIQYLTAQQGILSIDSATVNNATQITVYLRNAGGSTLNVTSVYVDNIPQSTSPQFAVISPNQVQKFIIMGSGTSWADGLAHNIKIFASDGTPASASVRSS